MLAALALLAAGCEPFDDETTPTPLVEAEGKRGAPVEGGERRPSLPSGDGRGGVRLVKLGDFEQPLYVTQPRRGDPGHLYVVEQCGRIIRVPERGGAGEIFLDLEDLIACGGEQGLLSIAFDPDYERSGRLYVDYTDTDGDTRVVEYRRSDDDPAIADPESAREVLFIDQPATNHNGGLVLFGPDELLWVGTGDGGGGGDPDRNGQDLATLLGKILRIDPRPHGGDPYAIPRDNPIREEMYVRAEIAAFGLRNPWRFSFDRETGDLWIGDVGQDRLEEIDAARFDELIGGGDPLNFGWSAFEGSERFNEDQRAPGARSPVLDYALDGACAVTGGYVVRDPGLRSLYGRYLYGDYCAGELRSFTADPRGEPDDDRSLGIEIPGLSSFGEDAEGRIYATSLEGPVYRLAATRSSRAGG